jgi:hypothetical protein
VAEKDPYDLTEVDSAKELVVKAVEDCEKRYHNAFVEKVERRYRAYRALVEPKEGSGGKDSTYREDEDWHSNVTTPYVLQNIEGMIATMLEPKPKFDVKPRPTPEERLDEIIARTKRTSALEDILGYALERDDFSMKQRPYMQQDLIAGMTVMKTYWHTERRDVTRLVNEPVEILDVYGNTIDSIDSVAERTSKNVLVRDDACSEVWDVRDFFWPAQSPSVEKAEYIIFRSWESYPSCQRKGEAGYWKNVSKLKETTPVKQPSYHASDREMRLRNIDRTKDLVEVLEYWTPERVITVGNREVVLSDRKNPFWHGRIPAIVCSSVPDAFQIPGISVVEALAQLQEMLWTLQNQRLDVLRMVSNLIMLIRSDVDDPEAFEWAPNAQWFVEDPSQVAPIPIDATPATITLQAEALIKGDLQNIMGGLPMAGGVDSGAIDQETATGISIITSIAQKIIQARKQHYLWSYAKLGKHFLLLYQQFLRDERVVRILGEQGAASYEAVNPLDLQGDFDVMIDVTSDSLLRQERRAEAQALLQLTASTAPIAAQLGAPPNMRAYQELVLDAFDITDKERFFAAPPPAAAGPPGTPPPEGAVPGIPGIPTPSGNGVTNPGAAAGPMSPSAEGGTGLSPEQSMQRMMSMRGTPAGG